MSCETNKIAEVVWQQGHIQEERDPKGMYKRAREGKIQGFTGVNAPYEPPTSPSMTIDTTDGTPEKCGEKLLAELMQRIAVSKNETQIGKNR